jgi:hypothetical protein
VSKTITSSTPGPILLSASDNPLVITGHGRVTASRSGADGIDAPAGATWTIRNAGIVTAASGFGMSLASSGMVTNAGSISGIDGVVLSTGGIVVNQGRGSIAGNGAGGTGFGSGSGVYITGAPGEVTNRGLITGVGYGVALAAGGIVTNHGAILGGEDGVEIRGAPGSVVNSSTIQASVDDGVALFGGGSVSNSKNAFISGAGANGAGVFITGGQGTIANQGTISSGGSNLGVLLTGGGTISNAASATVSGGSTGVFVSGAAGTVQNSGQITAAGASGVDFEAGGSVTNAAQGTIYGSSYGVFLAGGSGTVTNSGTISGGVDAVLFGDGGPARVVVKPTAVFHGSVAGNSSQGNTIELAGGRGTVTGASGTSGTITENANSWSFSNFDTLAVDRGGSWTFSGPNTVQTLANNGTIGVTGALDVATIDPASAGIFQLTGGSLEVAAAIGSATKMQFLGNGSELIVDNAAAFGNQVGTPAATGPLLENFGLGDMVDLKQFAASGSLQLAFNPSSGILQVSNGTQVADLSFQKSSLGPGSFHARADGATGVLITHSFQST